MLKVPDGWSLHCVGQGHRIGIDPVGFVCPTCGDILELTKIEAVSTEELFPPFGPSNVWRYAAAIPHGQKPISLSEGGTPLVQSRDVSARNLFFKIEGQNPTGSFKDRGMTVAVTRAVESEAEVLVCASTGNTAASLAAYAARAGLKSAVILPSGKVAAGKLAQAIAHGARLVQVDDGFDKAFELTTKAVALSKKLYLLNSINPYRIEGQKSVSFEIYEQLGDVPEYVILPVGNAGNISAVWKGFREMKEWGITSKVPKMVGVQAEGAAPIAEAYAGKWKKVKPWRKPETVASAIRIGNPVSWKKALKAVEESKGMVIAVPDREIVSARKELATKEGIYVENASAAPLAGLRRLRGDIGRGSKVVCILTGHGLKDKVPVSWKVKPSVAKSARDLARMLA